MDASGEGTALRAGDVTRARDLLEGAERVLVLTGAGMSAESGVPTFRGPGGLWKSFRPEELATPEAFRRDPRLVWEWYAWRRELILGCAPHAGHLSLARWLLDRSGSALLATQNVDGLHVRAHRTAEVESGAWAREGSRTNPGSLRPAPILELHGSLFHVRCTACGDECEHLEAVDATSPSSLPRCGRCGGLLRPAVVWYGEMLPAAVIDAAFEWARTADLALVVGTSALVHPAASLPLLTSAAGGAVLEVNPERSPLSDTATLVLPGPAGTVLPLLLEAREPGAGSVVF